MYTSCYAYALGYKDARAGRTYRDSIPKGSRLRPWLDEYEKGWQDARNYLPSKVYI